MAMMLCGEGGGEEDHCGVEEVWMVCSSLSTQRRASGENENVSELIGECCMAIVSLLRSSGDQISCFPGREGE